MRERLLGIDKPLITVADRESDIFEFLYELIENKESFVIRAQHNRALEKKQGRQFTKLEEVLSKSSIRGKIKVTIQDVNSRETHTLLLSIKTLSIHLPIPTNIKKRKSTTKTYQPIYVNVVQAYSDEHEWVLLTNLPIETNEETEEVINIYRARWHIEDFHKVLKTGYQVDEIYLHESKKTILNLLSMACISACRLYWLIYTGRTKIDIKANEVFEEFEWKAIYVLLKEKIPPECPFLSEIIIRIARLGGFKNERKASPPGIKTMWIGYQQFSIAAQMYRNMSMIT